MNNFQKMILIAALSGAIGAMLGAVSGSNNLGVVAIVGGVFGGLSAWVISSFVK